MDASFLVHFEVDIAQQPGLFLSVSPDSFEGSRMSYVGLDDQSDGIHVIIYDTPLDRRTKTLGYEVARLVMLLMLV